MQDKCSTPNIIYEAAVTNNTDIIENIYFGLCETSLKERYRNHNSSFRLQSRSKHTELSNYVWELKNENKIPFICLKINKQKQSYTLHLPYQNPKYNFPDFSPYYLLMTHFFINNLLWCLHLLANADCLFNNFSSPMELLIYNFSIKHNLQ